MIGDSDVLISRRSALDAICDNCDTEGSSCAFYPCGRYTAVEKLPIVHPTLYGYEFKQLAVIANVLQKEGLTPDRVKEAITDIDRIILMVRDDFEEELRNSVKEWQTIIDKKGES